MTLLTASAFTVVRAGDWPFHRKADPNQPNTLVQIARSIDAVEAKIRDKGLIVLKHPDVWSQARMTKYRTEFETVMAAQRENFTETLQAVVNRSDQASFQSETALAAVLTPTTRTSGRRNPIEIKPEAVSTALTVPTSNTFAAVGFGTPATLDSDGNLKPGSPTSPVLQNFADPFTSLKNANSAFSESLMAKDAEKKLITGVGLDPTVVLDEHKRYLDHLHELRRVNMGDDIADSAGYGLYLLRMPISIQPGECTYKGHGAQLSVTARPEFGTNFMAESVETFIVNDIVDQIGPIVYDLIRRGHTNYREILKKVEEAKEKAAESQAAAIAAQTAAKAAQDEVVAKKVVAKEVVEEAVKRVKKEVVEEAKRVREEAKDKVKAVVKAAEKRMVDYMTAQTAMETAVKAAANAKAAVDERVAKNEMEAATRSAEEATQAADEMTQAAKDVEMEEALATAAALAAMAKTASHAGASRVDTRSYPVSVSDMPHVFLRDNLLLLAEDTAKALQTETPRAVDVRSYLRHELRSAYQIMSGRRGGVNLLAESSLVEDVRSLAEARQFDDICADAAKAPVLGQPWSSPRLVGAREGYVGLAAS